MLETSEANKLITSLFELSKDEAMDLFSKKMITSTTDKLTAYSLFKQAEEGDCPEEPGESTDMIKHKAWL